MFIHIGKTSLMTAGSRQNIGHINMEVFIDGEIIKEVENQKLLGIITDKTLSWDKQIDVFCLNNHFNEITVKISRQITFKPLLQFIYIYYLFSTMHV